MNKADRLLRPLIAIVAATVAVMGAPSALADRPLASETADAIAAGTCQVESALLGKRARGAPTVRGWDNLFSCGLAHDTQAAIGYARERGAGETVQSVLLAGKTSLLVPQAERTGWGLAYAVGALRAPGQGLRADGVRVTGLATRELASGLLGHANLGWSYSRIGNASRTLWSLGIETTADFTVAADLFGDDRGRPTVSAGFGYTLLVGFSVNLSYALQFESPRVKSLGVGAKLVF